MITESEYRLGRSCSWKIAHSRAGLPRNDTENSFAHWMHAESGKVKALANHLFPDATKIIGCQSERAKQTKWCLKSERCAADARFLTEDASCNVDFAVREGSTIRLYSVVPKCVDLDAYRNGTEFTTQSGRLRKEWRDHLEIMALRVWIVQRVWPQYRILPFFVAPVRNARATMEGLHVHFQNTPQGWTASPDIASQATLLLRTLSVGVHCLPLVDGVQSRLAALDRALRVPSQPDLKYGCKGCEFRAPGADSGYRRCWGTLASVTPSMWDVGYMYFIQDDQGQPIANKLARDRTVSMFDLPLDRITGEHAHRQVMQIEGTRAQSEFIDLQLAAQLNGLNYPQFFLDIETLRSVVPAHKGAKVNGLSLFQFSIHRRDVQGGPLDHVEWLNTEPESPNIRFLSALRAALGEEGPILIWTRYEEASFAELLAELIGDGVESDDMRWLKRLLVGDRIVDLHQLCFAHYWHPRMAGKTSIKAVLPAVWSEASPIKELPPYNQFPADTDPYAALKKAGQVADGCEAMRAYLDLQSESAEARSKATEGLLRYNWVDTVAMCFIVDYWQWKLDQMLRETCMVGEEAGSVPDAFRGGEQDHRLAS